VSAKDRATGKEQSIRIEGSGGLQKDEIERMVKDAEAHASEDHARRDRIEKRNQLDSLVYQAEKTLRDNADKVEEADRKPVEEAIADAKRDLDSDDAAKLDAARQRLEQSLHKVAEALYTAQAAGEPGAAAPGAGPAGGASAGGAEGDVIDAEYTEDKGPN
jgi:molecular chaperone DnaK